MCLIFYGRFKLNKFSPRLENMLVFLHTTATYLSLFISKSTWKILQQNVHVEAMILPLSAFFNHVKMKKESKPCNVASRKPLYSFRNEFSGIVDKSLNRSWQREVGMFWWSEKGKKLFIYMKVSMTITERTVKMKIPSDEKFHFPFFFQSL